MSILFVIYDNRNMIMTKYFNNKYASIILGFVVGAVNGFFGSGGGSVYVPQAQKRLKIEAHKAHATAIALILPLSIVSTLFYYSSLDIKLSQAVLLCIGGIVGGTVGAKLLKKVPTGMLHIIFGGFMLLAAARSVFR